jgi:anti-sigma factor RsiW
VTHPIGPFDHARDAAWLMAYADGELNSAQAAVVGTHLETCAACRADVERFGRERRLLTAIRLKEAPPEDWEAFWRSGYNRAERGVAWIVFVVGAALLGAWGLYHGVTALLRASSVPWPLRAGVLAVALGLVLLLISVLRERLFARRRTRYKDVVR